MKYIKTSKQALEIFRANEECNSTEYNIRLLTRALNLEPLNLEARFERGFYSYVQNNYKLAIADLNICSHNKFNAGFCNLCLALIYYTKREYQLAVKHFKQAGNPILFQEDFNKYGECLFEIGEYREASFYLRKYIKLFPEKHYPYYILAHSQYFMNEYMQSLQNINRAIEIDARAAHFYLDLKMEIRYALEN